MYKEQLLELPTIEQPLEAVHAIQTEVGQLRNLAAALSVENPMNDLNSRNKLLII